MSDVYVQLSMRYILQGVNLEVQHGEFVSMEGENGAGKATLLKKWSVVFLTLSKVKSV
jgi:ABC-type Mn2+/Zn2+ transport system ATPase subunit